MWPMSQFFEIHPQNPQARLIAQAAEIVRQGGVIVYPTDSSYAIGCQLNDKSALQRIQRIRDLDKNHNFTLVCSDLSQLALYAKVDNQAFRLVKSHTPGPYTFILKATSQVPKRLAHPKRKTIGLRMPEHPITLALLAELGEPMMSCSLILPDMDELELADIEIIRERLEQHVELIIDGGATPLLPTTVVDLTEGQPEVVRLGGGVVDWE